MVKQVNIELMHYRSIRDWKPKVGDLIIKHGWVFRTKWFGVINFIHPDGMVDIIKDGMVRLLVMTPPDAMAKKATRVDPNSIITSVPGTYAIHQEDNNVVVWYV